MSINIANFFSPPPHPSPRIFPSHPTLPPFPPLSIPIYPGDLLCISQRVSPAHRFGDLLCIQQRVSSPYDPSDISMKVVAPTIIKMRIFINDSTGETHY